MTDYERWKRANDNGRGWKIKYYKGLGTSSPEEAKDYFGALSRHQITFRWNGDADGQLLDMVFNPKKAPERKEWIGCFEVLIESLLCHASNTSASSADKRVYSLCVCSLLSDPSVVVVGH
jgi:hypothetical protein